MLQDFQDLVRSLVYSAQDAIAEAWSVFTYWLPPVVSVILLVAALVLVAMWPL